MSAGDREAAGLVWPLAVESTVVSKKKQAAKQRVGFSGPKRPWAAANEAFDGLVDG